MYAEATEVWCVILFKWSKKKIVEKKKKKKFKYDSRHDHSSHLIAAATLMT